MNLFNLRTKVFVFDGELSLFLVCCVDLLNFEYVV